MEFANFFKKEEKMKKFSLIAITVIIASVVLISNVFAQEPLYWLMGDVRYEVGGGVGSDKPVVVSFQNGPIKMDYDTVYTHASSRYQWSFGPTVYVYKVSCRFHVDDTWYSGETAINQTLSGDTEVDITVYEE